MTTKNFQYGPLKVSVKDAGEGVPPWNRREETVYRYEVTVRGQGGAKYVSDAWGSINDYQGGTREYRGLAQMVVGELWDAANDPDEFFNLVIGEAEGREAYERGKIAERVVNDAQKFDPNDLEAAANAARDEEERG